MPSLPARCATASSPHAPPHNLHSPAPSVLAPSSPPSYSFPPSPSRPPADDEDGQEEEGPTKPPPPATAHQRAPSFSSNGSKPADLEDLITGLYGSRPLLPSFLPRPAARGHGRACFLLAQPLCSPLLAQPLHPHFAAASAPRLRPPGPAPPLPPLPRSRRLRRGPRRSPRPPRPPPAQLVRPPPRRVPRDPRRGRRVPLAAPGEARPLPRRQRGAPGAVDRGVVARLRRRVCLRRRGRPRGLAALLQLPQAGGHRGTTTTTTTTAPTCSARRCSAPGSSQKTTGWCKKMGERIWTPWFIKFVHSRGYFNIYTNFLKERALSISHRDAGVNYRRSVGPDSTLLDGKNIDFNIWELQPLKKLKWYNFCFSEVLPGRVVKKFSELGSVLESLQLENNVVLISLFSIEQIIGRNLICHLEKAGMRNYIFLGDNSEFLDDLAHRGHPVIDAIELLQSIQMSSFVNSDDFVKEILVKSYVIKSCLDLGYNLWVLNGNMISLGSKLIKPSDQSIDLFTADSVDMMFIRSSQDSKKAWNELVMLRVADRLMYSKSDFATYPEHKNFVRILNKVLKNNGGVRLGKLDKGMMAIELGPNTSNRSLPEGQSKVLFWSHSMASDSVQSQLKNINLWLIDSDLSCSAVVCSQKQK